MRPKYIGKPIERFEDSKFLSGNAKYTSDINIDKMLQLVFVRSDEAHAKIKYIEYKEALKLDGIIDILTFKDFDPMFFKFSSSDNRYIVGNIFYRRCYSKHVLVLVHKYVPSQVTLRSVRMYEFLDRLISVAIPRVRDFRGISGKQFDGRGNFAMGVTEQIIFPEIDYDQVDKLRGMDIVITTSATNDEQGRALLSAFNFPFKG